MHFIANTSQKNLQECFMKSVHVNFTKKTVSTLDIPSRDEVSITYYDTGCQGLQIIATYGGTKTYYFAAFFNGKQVRRKIGRIEDISLDDARGLAYEYRGMIIKNINPATQSAQNLLHMTLKDFYDKEYRPRHMVNQTRPKTVQKNDSLLRCSLKPFHNTKMENITRNDVDRLHAKLKQEVSVYTANRAIVLLGHMFKMACEWGNSDEMYNPTNGIKKFKEASRDRFIQPAELQSFFKALDEETNYQFRDFVTLSLLVGQRRNNMLSMRWENVNLVDQDMPFAYFPDSKNGEPQRIPLSSQAYDILQNMKKRQGNPSKGWVFPSDAKKSTSGHVEDYHRPWYALLKRAGIEDFRFHDLRRTFGSYQAISGSSLQIIGKALGDKTQIAIQVYSRLTLDPVRDSIQRGADKMFEFVGSTKKQGE